MKLSIVINCDTRNRNDTFTGSNLGGVVNEEFLYDGIINKLNFFEGFEKEVIIHVDKHEQLEYETVGWLSENSNMLIIRDHTEEHGFNDWNYIRALSQAKGDITIHIDQDTALFRRSKEDVEELLNLVNSYSFISYPSYWTPYPVIDPSFDHIWCSTRFFMCKTRELDIREIIKCANDYNYWCETYPVNRRCAWLEHWIGSIAKYRNQKIFYPPIELDKYAIFSWGSYKMGTLFMLNKMPYNEVHDWIKSVGGISYPNDIHVK